MEFVVDGLPLAEDLGERGAVLFDGLGVGFGGALVGGLYAVKEAAEVAVDGAEARLVFEAVQEGLDLLSQVFEDFWIDLGLLMFFDCCL